MPSSSARAKRRRTGTCLDCGTTTRYSGQKDKPVADRCRTCANRLKASNWCGNGPSQRKLLALLATEGELHFMEIKQKLDIPVNFVGPLVCSLHKQGMVERPRRGVYRLPSTDTPIITTGGNQ